MTDLLVWQELRPVLEKWQAGKENAAAKETAGVAVRLLASVNNPPPNARPLDVPSRTREKSLCFNRVMGLPRSRSAKKQDLVNVSQFDTGNNQTQSCRMSDGKHSSVIRAALPEQIPISPTSLA
jgi:hypothetical protein